MSLEALRLVSKSLTSFNTNGMTMRLTIEERGILIGASMMIRGKQRVDKRIVGWDDIMQARFPDQLMLSAMQSVSMKIRKW